MTACAAAKVANLVYHSRAKHVEIHLLFVGDKVESREIEVQFIPSKDQVPDILTSYKHTDMQQIYLYFRNKLNVFLPLFEFEVEGVSTK